MKSNIIKAVPIKVKVGATFNDKPKFPDWQMLSMAEERSPVEDMYFSWFFDKTGYRENKDHSPYGLQWAIRLVSQEFALQAIDQFPDEIFILDEQELREFWHTYITAHLPDQVLDHEQLSALNSRLQITKQMELDDTEVKMRIRRALDPDHPSAGVRWHPYKDWDRYKNSNNIEIISI